jgi:hypothetical protein
VDVSLILMACVIVVVIAALGYFIIVQVQGSASPKPGNTDRPGSSSGSAVKKSAAPDLPPYRSTSIRPGKNACDAALAIVEERFLVENGVIPPLPLPACDAASCTCKYIKHSDRREDDDEDRRDIVGMNRNMGAVDRDEDRRSGRERRKRSALEWRDN